MTNVCGNREEEVEEEYEEGGDEEEQGHLEYVTHDVIHDVTHQAPAEVDKWPLSFWMVNREIFYQGSIKTIREMAYKMIQNDTIREIKL